MCMCEKWDGCIMWRSEYVYMRDVCVTGTYYVLAEARPLQWMTNHNHFPCGGLPLSDQSDAVH